MRIFGIDQTGAILKGNKARNLQACELLLDWSLVDKNEKNNQSSTFSRSIKIKDVSFFQIPHLGDWIKSISYIGLGQSEIISPELQLMKSRFLESEVFKYNSSHSKITGINKNYIFIDCVFGLPVSLYKVNPSRTIQDWIGEAKGHHFNQNIYGRVVSEDFFNLIKKFYGLKNIEIPRRKIEIYLNSNSVFTTRPYQKNIQTGTYRIWKELAEVLKLIHIWPLDNLDEIHKNNYLFEVYPSFFYKLLFNSKVRSLKPILDFFANNRILLSEQKIKKLNNPDVCDALVSAIGGFKTLQSLDVFNSKPDNGFFEGSILGGTLDLKKFHITEIQ